MTLQEKFENVEMMFENQTSHYSKMYECEKIADEFAIEFAKYVLSQIYNMTHGNKAGISIEELLEIYKKEKGL